MDSTDDATRQLRANEDFAITRTAWEMSGTNGDVARAHPPELEDPSFLSGVTEELLHMSNIEEPVHVHAQNRYAPPRTDEAVTKARAESVPKKTREDTAYCMKLWQDWASKILTLFLH